MRVKLGLFAVLVGCGGQVVTPSELPAGVVFTYPRDRQMDVPTGAHLIVSFSDPTSSTVSVVGPDGPVDATTSLVGGGKTLSVAPAALVPGTQYSVAVDETPVFTFTTRSDRPLAGPPTLIAMNGSEPSLLDFRPILETSTLQLVFSEPLDPRSVALETRSIELVDSAGAPVAATLLARGIHVAIDPISPLTPGETYEVRLGDHLRDLGGDALAATSVSFTPVASLGSAGPVHNLFRTRVDGDPDAAVVRTDAGNSLEVVHPLIGSVTGSVEPSVLMTELGDPTALGGPIAFTIARGNRLRSSGLSIALAGAVPSGLTTGDIEIEFLTDAGGRLYRNSNDPEAPPDNDRAPLLADLSADLAIYATDPTGNAVLAQTVLGVQLAGIAIADDGALAIETVGSIDIGLLGLADAPTNLVLDLISDPSAELPIDAQPPTLLATQPAAGSSDLDPSAGIELIFDEPLDLDRARAGGIHLTDDAGADVAIAIESHGSVAVVRPRAPLADGRTYTVSLDIADVAGNAMPATSFTVSTPVMVPTDAPLGVLAIYPGAPCAVAGESNTSGGRCVGANPNDDPYPLASIGADEHVAVVFDQPVNTDTAVLGTACGAGSVRVEHLDASGTCTEAVSGTLVRRARDLAFIPDRPWLVGEHYRVRLVSGPDTKCDPGELCGANGKPASFDPLDGMTGSAAGGADLVADFIGDVATGRTNLVAGAAPYGDVNGSGKLETGEVAPTTNRVALKIAGTGGLLTQASFTGADCMPETPDKEGCMYMLGAIPAQLGAARTNCTLPDGSTAPTCVPVEMTPQIMFSTSLAMSAGALGISIPTQTGTSVMRMRDHGTGPLEGYIIDRNGQPTMVTALDLYMDAPDMSVPLATHDLHSKPLSVQLEGPVTFRPDGRLSLALSNTADVPISVGINAPLGISGTVNLVVPKGDMQLQLLTPPQRGSVP
jgi:hypothetical protein